MSDPLIARFADACGATGPLDLRVDLAGSGGVLAEGSVAQPFTLVGRDDACDVTLSDPEVNMRHAWVQVLGGRAFAVDLGSRSGLVWPGGACGRAGLTSVRRSVSVPSIFRSVPRPPTGPALILPATIRWRPIPRRKRNWQCRWNSATAAAREDRWQVNRLLTLIGRAPTCKIHLNADDISPYHCGIVSTRSGLWVVDLSGARRGGERRADACGPVAA